MNCSENLNIQTEWNWWYWSPLSLEKRPHSSAT